MTFLNPAASGAKVTAQGRICPAAGFSRKGVLCGSVPPWFVRPQPGEMVVGAGGAIKGVVTRRQPAPRFRRYRIFI